MMQRRHVACAAAIALMALAHTASAQEPYPGLDNYISNAVQTWKIPGVAVAIVRNDSVLYTKGFGVLSAGSHTPVDDQTLFEIGSSTKLFTATVVAMMVSDGKMKYDDLMSKYLPDFKLYDPIASSQLTLRDALTHRSGLGRGDGIWGNSGATREEVLHRIRFLKPESPFRSRWSYQNIMFLASGEAAGRAGGSTWDDLVKQRIFVPLGMTSSVTTFHDHKTKNAAMPHGMDHDTAWMMPTYYATEGIAPAGSIMSNARDMAQWLRFHMNDGVVNGKRLVSSAAFREIHTPQILMGGGGGRGGAVDSIPVTVFSAYGFGLMIEDYHRNLMWQHGGNTAGMTTAVGMLPERKIGVVVLSSMSGAALPALLMHYIFDRQLGLPVKDYSGEAYARTAGNRGRADSVEKAQAAVHKPGTPAPLPLTAYVGTYADSMYGEATVSIKNGQLDLVRGVLQGPLEYWNANNFRWTTGPVTRQFIRFEVTPNNTVTSMYWGAGVDQVLMGRKSASGGGRGGRGARGGGGGQ
jgi:CubicO group peptidase (beta-lactamase class C family)